VADLEQRLAQQGRELAERDRKIEGLEWHIAAFAERFDRLPDLESNASQVDQRLQDLEWQLSNLHAQLAGLPGPEEERALYQEAIAHAVADAHDRAAAERAEMEARLRAEIAAFAESEDLLTLRQAEQAQALDELGGEMAAVQGRFTALSSQLGETAERLAVETRSATAAALQERLEALAAENRSRVDQQLAGIAASQHQWESKWTRLEEGIAELGRIGEIAPLLERFEQELDLRQAGEHRLADRIDAQENRIGPMSDRMAVVSDHVMKVEADLETWTRDQIELRERVAGLIEDLERDGSEIDQKLEGWQGTLDDHKDTIEQFAQQWLSLSDQYREARNAVQNFAHWQKQLEQQKRETSEALRAESNRIQSRWDSVLQEVQDKLKGFELDLGQKWQAFELENERKWTDARRGEQSWREQFAAVEELIQRLQQDNRNLIWRVQTAQIDAIKKWPLLLMEEVERAIEVNLNRPLAPVDAGPHSSISVVDAIERGLITVDYESELIAEL
jgi:chromosome segregation ATPase